ncbi:hypothetical protein JRQ81_012196 [Phrynocephalus forsythii]|uniref:LRRNT domain-containing protein n=1 Tax=Phrynocephalus forsythii TaxID=171643 RepID=A0A9Q0X5H7_9SAUR|nr:hypothetical protein JRQ81_012196 [Phrynocephalus forsythii]
MGTLRIPLPYYTSALALVFLIGVKWPDQGWSCPPECICFNLQVNCQSRGLDNVPDSVPLTTRELILSKNYFKEIPPLEISYLHDLVYLDCSHNMIEMDGESSFPAAEKLIYLDLSFNHLTIISSHTFSELHRLVFLNISSNRLITKIMEDAFTPTRLLRSIDASFCGFDSLSVKTVDHLHNLHILGIKGNPLDCNCTFLELCSWLRNTFAVMDTKPRIKLIDSDEITCKKPAKLEGWQIFKAEDEVHHECLLHVKIMDLVILGLITFCIFIGGTVVAGMIGMTTVIYHHPVMKVGDESDEEEEYKIYASNI